MAVGLINKGAKVSVCVTPQTTQDLTPTAYAALAYIEICCPTEIPEISEEANMLSQFCISGIEKTAVGTQTGAEFDISFMYEAGCVGQDVLREAAGTQNSYAFKIERADGSATQTPTTIFLQAMVGGWTYGGGGPDDFVSDVASLKISQKPILVKPTAIP